MTVAFAALTPTQRFAYQRALSEDCLVHTQVRMLTLSHTLVSNVSDLWDDGQVNINASDGAQKVLSCGFRDPGHQLHLDAASPAAGVNSIDRLLQVTQFVLVRELGQWVSTDVVTARPTSVKRNAEMVTVEAQSKESLHLRNVPSYTIPKGTNVVTAIRRILTKSGETRFKFPANVTAKIPRDVHVGGPDENRQPWLVCRRLAKSISRELSYDPAGYAWMRVLTGNPQWLLVDTPRNAGSGAIGPNLLTPVATTTDLSQVKNRVVVTYHTTATKKKKSQSLNVVAVAPPSHPFSAQSLAANGVPWVSSAFFDQQDIHSAAAAQKFANAQLNALLEEAITIEATATPVYHLNARDLLEVRTRDATFNVRFNTGTIPLGPTEDGMSIGFQKYLRRPTTGITRRK